MKAEVGQLRPSQLLFSFGVGAVVDLPHLSAMVMGLDDWPHRYAAEIVEPRLLTAVRAQPLFSAVDRLLGPPLEAEVSVTPGQGNGAAPVGVPVAAFPQWLRCPRCDLLAPISTRLFDLKRDPYHPDRTRFVHANCQKAKNPPAVLPARFLVACDHGHLDDFPWVEFVHKGKTSCHFSLRLREHGISGEAKDIEIRCEACGSSRRMSDAFGEENAENLPPCPGRRPHLRDREEDGCTQPQKAILLGASNSWFAVSLSLLSLPTEALDPLAALVDDRWADLKDCQALGDVDFMRRKRLLGLLEDFPNEAILQAIEAHRTGQGASAEDASDLKRPEWALFANPQKARATDDFQVRSAGKPPGFEDLIDDVILVERVREVRALLGFTRIESPGNYSDVGELPAGRRAPLSRHAPRWVPASEVRGEGLFIRFKEEAVARWCQDAAAAQEAFFAAHRHWRAARKIDPPAAGFPGIRYVLLHTLSHALMRQHVLECGYSAASVRERLYAQNPEDDGGAMAGILLYTAAPDSEGTLGGLVALGKPANLARHLHQALEAMQLCASDPLCSEHHPGQDGLSLHGAACHACLFAPETSCERGNKYLDRSLLVPTFGASERPFFGHPELEA